MAEVKVCKQCGVTERRRSSTQRDKFINSGTLDVDYPICRKCARNLIRPDLSNAASTMDEVLPTVTTASVSNSRAATPASVAAVARAETYTSVAPSSDDTRSSLNRVQTSRNITARDRDSFLTRSLHVHTREATPIGAANFKAIAYLSTGMDEVKDDCVELDGDVLKYLFPTHPKIKSHTENETPLVLFKCKGCGESFVKLKNDNSRFCQSFSCSNKRKRKMGSISKDNIPQTTDTVVSSILSILSAATSKKDDAAVIRIARQLYLISPESLAEYNTLRTLRVFHVVAI